MEAHGRDGARRLVQQPRRRPRCCFAVDAATSRRWRRTPRASSRRRASTRKARRRRSRWARSTRSRAPLACSARRSSAVERQRLQPLLQLGRAGLRAQRARHAGEPGASEIFHEVLDAKGNLIARAQARRGGHGAGARAQPGAAQTQRRGAGRPCCPAASSRCCRRRGDDDAEANARRADLEEAPGRRRSLRKVQYAGASAKRPRGVLRQRRQEPARSGPTRRAPPTSATSWCPRPMARRCATGVVRALGRCALPGGRELSRKAARPLRRPSRSVTVGACVACVLLAVASARLLRLWPHAPLSETAGQLARRAVRAAASCCGSRSRATSSTGCGCRSSAISPTLIDAVLLYEDRRFHAHPGVNPAALVRSAWRIASGERRAGRRPPLTMQLARRALRHRQPHGRRQDRADRRRAVARSAPRQARDPRGLPQHRALRRQHRRRAGREPDLLSQGCRPAQPARGADARGDSAEPGQAHRRARPQHRAAGRARTALGAVGRARSHRARSMRPMRNSCSRRRRFARQPALPRRRTCDRHAARAAASAACSEVAHHRSTPRMQATLERVMGQYLRRMPTSA